jgi:hypothetical protein
MRSPVLKNYIGGDLYFLWKFPMKYPMELNMGEYGLEQIFPDT